MHPLFVKADKLSYEIIGAATEVHRLKGPGLIESIYEKCLCRELDLRKISCVNQKTVLIEYKGYTFEEPLRFDLLVENCVLVELKSVEQVLPVHKAQLPQLHETPRHPPRPPHQLPRTKTHRRHLPSPPPRLQFIILRFLRSLL